MRIGFVLILLCLPVLVTAPVWAELNPDQFAFGLPLEVSGDQAFYELELPLAVYRGSQRDDLGDVSVFNASGKVVQHALRRPDNKTLRQDVATSSLPFFPLQAERSGDNISVHVERTKEGTIVDVHTGKDRVSPDENRANFYLLDASHLKSQIDSLELVWADDAATFLSEVEVETSHDLVHWKPLTVATVGWLQYNEFRLDQNRIVLPRANSRYLRLRWQDGRPAEKLAKVTVLTRKNRVVERPASRRLVLDAERVDANLFRADVQAALPVSSVSVQLPDKNSLASVRLVSRADAKGMTVTRWQGLVYNIASHGQSFISPAIPVTPLRHRFWELQIEKSELAAGLTPRLELFWQPDRLVFLAQGAGPFYIAYGSNQVEPSNFHVDSLLRLSGPDGKKSFSPGLASPGKPYPLGGPDSLSHRPPLPWKEYSLWGILSLGVLLIGWMSLSLYRNLRDDNSGE